MSQNWYGYHIIDSCKCANDSSGRIIHPSFNVSFCDHIEEHSFVRIQRTNDFKILKYSDKAFEYIYRIDREIYDKYELNTDKGKARFHYTMHCNCLRIDDKQYRNNLMFLFLKNLLKKEEKSDDELKQMVNNYEKKWKTVYKKDWKNIFVKKRNAECIKITKIKKIRIARPLHVKHNIQQARTQSDQLTSAKYEKIEERASLFEYLLGTTKLVIYIQNLIFDHTPIKFYVFLKI